MSAKFIELMSTNFSSTRYGSCFLVDAATDTKAVQNFKSHMFAKLK